MDPPVAPDVPDRTNRGMIREAATAIGELFVHRRDRKAVYRPDRKNRHVALDRHRRSVHHR